jgi:hypothetical protein
VTSDTRHARSAESAATGCQVGELTTLKRRDDARSVGAAEARLPTCRAGLMRAVAASAAVVFGGGLSGCVAVGGLNFEGSDSIGNFSGHVTVATCREDIRGDSVSVFMGGLEITRFRSITILLVGSTRRVKRSLGCRLTREEGTGRFFRRVVGPTTSASGSTLKGIFTCSRSSTAGARMVFTFTGRCSRRIVM